MKLPSHSLKISAEIEGNGEAILMSTDEVFVTFEALQYPHEESHIPTERTNFSVNTHAPGHPIQPENVQFGHK